MLQLSGWPACVCSAVPSALCLALVAFLPLNIPKGLNPVHTVKGFVDGASLTLEGLTIEWQHMRDGAAQPDLSGDMEAGATHKCLLMRLWEQSCKCSWAAGA